MRIAIVLLTIWTAFAADTPKRGANSGMSAERLARIAPRMKAMADAGHIAGTVTLIGRNGSIVHHEAVGYADIEIKRSMAKDTIAQIMSMTKPMVGTAIMMLAEEGKLGITDAVEKHLPEFRGQMLKDADRLKKPARPITIRDLMSHTSGMASNPPPGLAELYQRMDRTLAEASLIYSQVPLEFEPGTQWRYSNPGIALLGRIIEVAADQPFERFMADRLWTPRHERHVPVSTRRKEVPHQRRPCHKRGKTAAGGWHHPRWRRVEVPRWSQVLRARVRRLLNGTGLVPFL